MNFGEAAAKGRNVLSGHINVGEHHVHLHRAGSNTNDFFLLSRYKHVFGMFR